MRILPALLLAALCIGRSSGFPLSFEARAPGHFLAQMPEGPVEILSDRVIAGGVTLRFLQSGASARLEGLGPAAPSTYLQTGFRRTFQQFPRMAIRNLYPGIDAVFYGAGNGLEYDLQIAPGVSPEQIRISVEGARRVQIDGQGNLRMETATGVLQQMLPRVFQAGREIAAHYALRGGNEVEFRLGKHDARLPLTIDPVLAYANTFGGSGGTVADAIATDAQGNIYVAGQSGSIDFPTTANGFEPKLAPPLVALSNAGQTTTPLAVGNQTTVQAIGGTPDGKILYAATPGGIYLSVDSGANWQYRDPLPPRPAGSSDAVIVNQIAVDALDPSHYCLATNYGLFSSCSNTGLPVGGGGIISVSSIIISPVNPVIAYATNGQPSSLSNHLYKNAGGSWQQLNPTYPGEPPVQSLPFSTVLAALAPNGNDLYVINGNGNLLKSTDAGVTWQVLVQYLYGSTSLVVDPSNASIIYVVDSAGLQRSVDGGLTFTAVNTNSAQGNNVGAITVDASGTLYATIQNLIYASTDRGNTFKWLSQFPINDVQLLGAFGSQTFVSVPTGAVPFVIKYDPTGSRILYSTFIGGRFGTVSSLKVDLQGEAVLAGSAPSDDFTPPVSGRPYFADGFVVKLSADGTKLIYSRVIGASQSVGLSGVAVDSSGAAYVTGSTIASDFPTTANAFQPTSPAASACMRTTTDPFVPTNLRNYAFVSKISADGSSVVYSTMLTGSCGSFGEGIAVDSAGEAIVVGYTTSPDFPASLGSYQATFPVSTNPSPPAVFSAGFVTKLSAAGDKVIAGTYLGGGYGTVANAVALDSSGNVYITGGTNGIAPGATPGAFQAKIAGNCSPIIGIGPGPLPTPPRDTFLLKLDATLTAAAYLTYLGGNCDDAGSSIALDTIGNIWVSGPTQSPDFPLRAPFQAPGFDTSGYPGFVSELSPDASLLLFSSMTDGLALAVDPSGAAYLAGSRSGSGLLQKIDPTKTPTVIVDSIAAVVGFPPPMIGPYSGPGVAPGQLIQITGRNLGPATKTYAQLDTSSRLPFMLANTTVFFDNIPAALISVQDSSITCFAPFEISRTTQISVVFNGQRSNAVRTGVTASAPQILSIANQDGTPNSATNPAKPGSVIVLYLTGLGETNPLSVDGLVNSFPLPAPAVPVTVYVLGLQVQPQFAGSAPGLISGITQVNVQLPATQSRPPAQTEINVNNAGATVYLAP